MQSITINDKLQVIQGDDQIYRYIAINNCTLDMDTLEKMTKTGDAWNGDRLCGNLIDIRQMLFIDSKTRAYAAAQYRPHVAGTAVLIDSKISSYFANIYLKFSQPKVPTRIFTGEEEAVKWLTDQMEKRRKVSPGLKWTMKTMITFTLCLFLLGACTKETNWKSLLDKNLTQWEMYLSYAHKPGYAGEIPTDGQGDTIQPVGYNINRNQVFTVVEESGEPVLRISGEIYGCVFTRQEFENYHLTLQVRWGTKKWDPRLDDPMDSGILYHSQGECGHDYWRSWMLSQELQIMEKSFGDYWSQMTSQMDIRATKPEGLDNYRFDPESSLLSFGSGTVNTGYCQRSEDVEKAMREWNTVELISFGDKSLHMVNGQVVMALSGSRYFDGGESKPLIKGKIQLQSEAAEVFYKDIRIRNITALPKQYTVYFD